MSKAGVKFSEMKELLMKDKENKGKKKNKKGIERD